jgi:ribosomal protein S20
MSGLGAAATVIAPLAAGIGVGELVLSLLDSNGVTVKDAAAMNKSLDSTDKTLASSWQQAAQTALTPGATQSGYGPAFATQMINQQMKSYSQELSDAFKWGFITKNQMAAKLANLTVAYNQSMALLQGGK